MVQLWATSMSAAPVDHQSREHCSLFPGVPLTTRSLLCSSGSPKYPRISPGTPSGAPEGPQQAYRWLLVLTFPCPLPGAGWIPPQGTPPGQLPRLIRSPAVPSLPLLTVARRCSWLPRSCLAVLVAAATAMPLVAASPFTNPQTKRSVRPCHPSILPDLSIHHSSRARLQTSRAAARPPVAAS